MADELDDAEIEHIYDEAIKAAEQYWIGNIAKNPYQGEKAEIWDCAYRNAVAKEHH